MATRIINSARKRKVKRAIRRHQIAQAALDLIAQSGVKALTTIAIARQVGISEANLYNHFKNKEEILVEAIDKIHEGLDSNIEHVLKSPSTPIRQLQRLFALHLEYIEKNAGIPRLIYSDEIHLGSRQLRQKLLNTINSYTRSVESLVRAGQEKDEVRRSLRPSSIVALFIGSVQITTLRWSLAEFSFPLVREGKKVWKDFHLCIASR